MFQLLLAVLLSANLSVGNSTDKLAYFKAFESDSKELVDQQIKKLNTVGASTSKEAYLGAMLMKQAQFEKVPKNKLAIFKEGKEKLERAIEKQPGNVEFRFLRYAIQENAPKVLKYNNHIEEDKKVIEEKYHALNSTMKKIVLDYAKNSKGLSVTRLN